MNRVILLLLTLCLLAAPCPVPALDLVAQREIATVEAKEYPPYQGGRQNAVSPCGDIGVVFKRGLRFDIDETVFHETTFASVEGRSETLPIGYASSVDVLYDSNCQPMVFVLDGLQYRVLHRTSGGAWTETTGNISVPGTMFPSTELVDFFTGLDGSTNVVVNFLEFPSQAGSFMAQAVHGTLTPGGWNFSALAGYPENALKTYGAKVDRFGRLHLVYRTPGGPEYSHDLNHHIWDGAQSQRRIVHAAPEIDYFPGSVDFDFFNDSRIGIVCQLIKTVVTGSPVYIRLNYFEERGDGGYNREEIVTTSDGYFGGDGNKYTGSWARIFVDRGNGVHISFTDISGWHNEMGHYRSIAGQLRLGHRHPVTSQWTYNTIFRQPGQSQSSNPLHTFDILGGGYSATGSHIHMFGGSSERASIDFQNPVVNRSKVHSFFAVNSAASTGPLPGFHVVSFLVDKRPRDESAFAALDRNGDGVIDGADVPYRPPWTVPLARPRGAFIA